jgi:hypothetical protein
LLKIPLASTTCTDSVQYAERLARARPARGAFSAAFITTELHEETGYIYHAARVVEYNNPAGAHDRSDAL